MKNGTSMGSYSRCHYHVSRTGDVGCFLGNISQWMGHLLYLVALFLWYRCWRRISHDCYSSYGKCHWIRSRVYQGRSSSSWTKSHYSFLDARLGSILQPSHSHHPPPHLP